ncbi:MAG: type 2 isopentenyl-diphosphate Delta-isomerase, partial [Scardovia wiggsiae]
MAMDDPEEADTETGGIVDDRATISSRKDDHVRLAQKFAREYPAGYQKEVYRELDGCEFIHRALPETSIDEVDISTCVAGIAQPSPIFINAMTGGTEATNKINMALAQAASR